MCLAYNEIERYLHHYAGRFQSSNFEHWELINEAWIRIHDLTIPAFASAGIRWAMQNYKEEMYMQKHRRNKKSVIQSIDKEIIDGLFCKDIIAAPTNKEVSNIESCDYVSCLLGSPKLTLADKLLIDQRYIQNLTMAQMSKIYGCTRQGIHWRLNKLLNTLKRITKGTN